MKLIMVMPAYNEEKAIRNVLESWVHEFNDAIGTDDYRIIVVDDGSRDETSVKITGMHDPHIILMSQPNSGHGKALYHGYMQALNMKPDWIFQTDSDGQTDPADFKKLWDARNDNNVLMGYRKHRQDGLFRMFSTRVLRLVFAILFHHHVVDSNTPFRLMKYDAFKNAMHMMQPEPDFTNILLTAAFIGNHEHIEFIETSFKPRDTGMNSVNMRNMGAKGIDAIKEMLAFKTRRRKMK